MKRPPRRASAPPLTNNDAPIRKQSSESGSCENNVKPPSQTRRLTSIQTHATGDSMRSTESHHGETKARILKRLLEQCEAVAWPFKKKLVLSNMYLAFEDIPTERICSEKIRPLLIKLSLRGNMISAVPDPLVLKLAALRSLNLSNCNLTELPAVWDLPSLKKLCLGRNSLEKFPKHIFGGLPSLEYFEFYENNLKVLKLPDELSVLSNLEYIDFNFNTISIIPAEELSKLPSLKIVKFMNNLIETVPELLCEMDLKILDVSSNPLIQPPLETCSRGLQSMRRYYKCLQDEENYDLPITNSFMNKMKAFPASLFRSISDSVSHKKTSGVMNDVKTPELLVGFDEAQSKTGDVAINDTLKVVFVGMAFSGKTSIIKRLIEGKKATVPNRDDRTIGVDIYPWRPGDKYVGYEKSMNTKIEVNENIRGRLKAPIDVKFSMWDFGGQDCYHATHELFFSSRALYVLVWNMAANNPSTVIKRSSFEEEEQGEFRLGYDTSDDEDGDDVFVNVERRRARRALEKDIDEKLNFWVHTIQSSAPGAAILPVASFDDHFSEQDAEIRCKIMKDRLLKTEASRIKEMKQRLEKFQSSEVGDGNEALLIQKLMCSFNRPKLIFGIDEVQDVIRVSSTEFTGFDRLAACIVNIATGRERGNSQYPIFSGHIGARIPRMRLVVRDAARSMREQFKVVESGYFLAELEKRGAAIMNPDDVSDALHFLTDIGELSFFGETIGSNRERSSPNKSTEGNSGNVIPSNSHSSVSHMLRDDASNKSASSSTPLRLSSETSSSASDKPSGFGEFIFLNPRWLVAAIACILRHDLTREIYEVRRMLNQTSHANQMMHKASEFSETFDTDVNYPVISSRDMHLLWETKRFTKKAAERAQQYSNNKNITPFDFLQQVLVRFSVFVPIDLTIEKACLGGTDYTHLGDNPPPYVEPGISPKYFFLPSLLGTEEPKEAWTFKTVDSWKTTLCHTVLFPDGSPPGLMERLIGSILNDFYTLSSTKSDGITDLNLRLKETICWRTAFFLRIAVDVIDGAGVAESIVDIFVILVDPESSYCVSSDTMGVGMRKLIISGRGQAGDYGSKIWKGGYSRVISMIKRYLRSEYGGLEYEYQVACPLCLSSRPIAQAGFWNLSQMLSLAETDHIIRCRYGHGTDIRLLTALQGPFSQTVIKENSTSLSYLYDSRNTGTLSISETLKSVVLVGVWDDTLQRISHAGSGFVVDKKRGFIVSAAHTVLDRHRWREQKGGKIVIGVIPSNSENVCCFRYFARIISKDPSITSKGFCTVDACVLQITTRMENDVFDSGKAIGEQPEKLLMNSPESMKREKLACLSVTDKIELDETIRILGFNQGGEGLLEPGAEVYRSADFARGYVVMRFSRSEISEQDTFHSFQPRSEIVVICPTIGGHSGGPCVNQQGEVIGILSRVDPADKQRCYLVPTSEFAPLIKEAKRMLKLGL